MEASMASAGSSNSSKGAPRILAKIDSLLESESYYEAHQLYKTLSHRYITQKKYHDAAEVLFNGSCILLGKQQMQSGSDLAMSLINTLAKMPPDERTAYIEKLAKIHSLIPGDSRERFQFVSGALHCTKTSTDKAGSPALHKQLANQLWQEQQHEQAMYHFLYASDGENCGKFLVEFHHEFGGNPVEVDLFIAQAILQLLCLRNVTTANVTFFTYVNSHPLVKSQPPFLLPLLNFIWFLLKAVNDGKISVFTVLCEKYQPSIERDPTYKQYLDRIGQNYFGVPPPASSGSGLFGGLMRSLLAGLAEDSGSEDESDSCHTAVSEPAALRQQAYTSSDLD